MPVRPLQRGDFKVAIICALPLEYDAVYLTFDEVWDEGLSHYGRAEGDFNNYTTGRIGQCNVVLTLLARMGKVSAASAATSLRSSFVNVRLALLVGVCGALPNNQNGKEIILGDVIVSKGVVQHDFGRLYPDKFVRKDEVADRLSALSQELRKFIVVFDTVSGLQSLEHRTASFLEEVQARVVGAECINRYAYPGASQDRLFETSYRHKHQLSPSCLCGAWMSDADPVCDAIPTSYCSDLGCDDGQLVQRIRLRTKSQDEAKTAQRPAIFLGVVASGDLVLKSAADRDRIARDTHAIAFEMESAGVWEQLPCIMVKGACDYADSHKNKAWQHFAAATAASAAKAILEQYIKAYPENGVAKAAKSNQVHNLHTIPFRRNKRFVGRTEITQTTRQMLFEDDGAQSVAIVGLGGIGKSQVALHTAYWILDNKPEYSVFWVSMYSAESFEQGYRQIATVLGIQVPEKDDAKAVVKQHLSSRASGKWLLIVDSADDMEQLFGSQEAPGGLNQHLPDSGGGLLLFTTRSRDIASAVAEDNIVHLEGMNSLEARQFLTSILEEKMVNCDDGTLTKLLDALTYLPLAISQAAAYMKRNAISVTKYLELLQATEKDLEGLMSREFHDNTPHLGAQNAIATTWLVSFDQIERDDPAAAGLMLFLSCIEPNQIPRLILPVNGTEEELVNAIGTLLGYSFLTSCADHGMVDMHHLVHLATRMFVRKRHSESEVLGSAIHHLAESFFQKIVKQGPTIERLFARHAIKALGDSVGVDAEDKPLLQHFVGLCLQRDCRYRSALRYYRLSYEVWQAKLPETHEWRIKTINQVALIHLGEQRPKDALKVLEAYVARICTATPDNESLPLILTTLSWAYEMDGRYKNAIGLLEKLVESDTYCLPAHDHGRMSRQQGLANVYLQDEQIDRAIELLGKVLDLTADSLPESDYCRLAIWHDLAEAYLENGQIKDAIRELEQVEAMLERAAAIEDSKYRLVLQLLLVRAYSEDGQLEKAIKLLEGHPPEPDVEGNLPVLTYIALSHCYEQNGQVEQASELIRRVDAMLADDRAENLMVALRGRIAQAKFYVRHQRYGDALRAFEKVAEISMKIGNKKSLLWCCSFGCKFLRYGKVHHMTETLDIVLKHMRSNARHGLLSAGDGFEILTYLAKSHSESGYPPQEAPLRDCLIRLRARLDEMLEEHAELRTEENLGAISQTFRAIQTHIVNETSPVTDEEVVCESAEENEVLAAVMPVVAVTQGRRSLRSRLLNWKVVRRFRRRGEEEG